MAFALFQVTVGVVVERRESRSVWAQPLWRPLSVLVGAPSAAPWTIIESRPETTVFYAGEALIELFRTETANYLSNLAMDTPLLWIVLGTSGKEPGMELRAVTADPAEGEALTGCGDDLVQTVAMPTGIIEVLRTFNAQHHVERPMYKRQRERRDPT